MTERERDELLLELKAGQDELKRDAKRVLGNVQGLAAARFESEGRLSDHERRLEALERKAG